jgi:hypothetical protein
VPEGVSEEAYYMGNCQKGNPYFNTYNPAWEQQSNLNHSNNNTLNPLLPNPAPQQQRKSSAFEEAMTSFVKMTQTNFQVMKSIQEVVQRNNEASMNSLDNQNRVVGKADSKSIKQKIFW